MSGKSPSGMNRGVDGGSLYLPKQLVVPSILETETKSHRPKTAGRHDQPPQELEIPKETIQKGVSVVHKDFFF